jgi:hypothetical protein
MADSEQSKGPGAINATSDITPASGTEERAREEARVKYAAILKELRPYKHECPYCNHPDWGVADLVEVPLRIHSGPLGAIYPGGRQAYVYIPVGCLNCGYTMYFHSGTLDLRIAGVPPEPVADEPVEDSE